MFPFNDTEPNRYNNHTIMMPILILVNVLVLFYEYAVMVNDEYAFFLYGTVPSLVWAQQGGGALSTITHIFLHGDLWHLFSNMSALWVFGRRVEDACGPWRFLCFYLTSGVCADILSTIINSHQIIPSIGASGAVFGVMGAYMVLYPKGRIRTLVLQLGIPIWPKIRAFWVILYFLAVQIIPAISIVIQGADYRIGYWAHLGGFIGSLLIFLFLRPEALARYRNDLPV